MFPQQYPTQRIEFTHGEGVYLFDQAGKRYLDFAAGISVNSFGYGDKTFARIAAEQIKKITHISNLFVTGPTRELAENLLQLFPEMSCVHFGNSGTEATESAIKYARMYALKNKGVHHARLVAFDNGFHGRTLGAASLHPQAPKNQLVGPLLPDCIQLPFNDCAAIEKHIDGRCAAVFVEPVQGEGGLDVLEQKTASTLQRVCAKHDVLIVADEIQTGLGRLGALTGSELIGLKPDIITLSKPLAAGLPLSAVLIPERVNACIPFAAHGTTFGGGPVPCALAREVIQRIINPKFLLHVQKMTAELAKSLQHIVDQDPQSLRLKGMGMLRGIALLAPLDKLRNQIIQTAAENGLLILPSGNDVLRVAPPLVINPTEIATGIDILNRSIQAHLR